MDFSRIDDDVDDRIEKYLQEVKNELERALALHGSMKSYHEGASVLREEYEELWDEVKMRTPDKDKMRGEAIQVAAMALRFVVDLL